MLLALGVHLVRVAPAIRLGWMIVAGLGMLIVWGGLIALIVLGVRALTRSDSTQPAASASSSGAAPSGALDILKERYARGEITKEQYDSMRRDLGA